MTDSDSASDAINPTVREPRAPGRRRLTLSIGGLLCAIGVLGFALSVMQLAGHIYVHSSASILEDARPPGLGAIALLSSAIAVASRCGLIAMGVLVLRRSPWALRITVMTFCVSLLVTVLDVSNFIAVAIEVSNSELHGIKPMQAVGAGCVQVLSIGLYVGVIVFLRSATTRAEWRDASRQR